MRRVTVGLELEVVPGLCAGSGAFTRQGNTSTAVWSSSRA